MKRLFLALMLLVTTILTATAQNFPVDTARINKAYKVLMSGECTTETEMEFLEAYPTTWLEFYMYKVTSAMAMKQGLSPDGGLFVPEVFPALTPEIYDKLMDQTYIQRAATVLGLFLEDFTVE